MPVAPAARRAFAAASLAATALLSACTASTGASTITSVDAASAASGNSRAVAPAVRAAVSSAEAPQQAWPGPNAGVPVVHGKKIVAITCGSQGYGCVQGAQGVVTAGRSLGWNVQVVDGKGDPSVWNAAVAQAVADKADGIVLAAINPALVQDGLAQARAAHIPVIAQLLPKLPGPSVDGYITTDHAAGGKVLADWMIADSGGRAKVLMLDEPEFPELAIRNNAIRAELRSACPGCTIVSSAKFSIGTMAQQLPSLVTSTLQSHPEIGYVVAPFDSAATFAAQGIQQAGTTTVKLVGAEGDPDGLSRVRSGAQAVDLATVPGWAGWAAVDDLLRLFQGRPVSNYTLPQRLFTAQNVPAGTGGWAGDVDYAAKFRAVWGQ